MMRLLKLILVYPLAFARYLLACALAIVGSALVVTGEIFMILSQLLDRKPHRDLQDALQETEI